MKCRPHTLKRIVSLVSSLSVAAVSGLILSPPIASAQQFVIKPVVEKKLKELPAGPLFWRIESFPSLAQAQAAAGSTGLAAEIAGKIWLFTLGGKGGVICRRGQGRRDRPCTAGYGAGISAPDQPCRRSARGKDTGAYPSRLRSILRIGRPAGSKNTPRCCLCRRWSIHEWT
jgi:hypothetical protein